MFFDFSAIPPEILNAIGVAGFATYVFNYLLLTLRIVSGHSMVYFVFNLLAASLVLISLAGAFNFASMLIQIFWIGISLIGIGLRLFLPTRQLV